MSTTPTIGPDLTITEADRVGAVFTLSMHSERFPELNRVVTRARLELAAAIRIMDASVTEQWPHGQPWAQIKVTEATDAYAQALADLLRGDQ